MISTKSQGGFTLFEMLIALTILTLIMFGATSLVTSAGGAFRTGSERLVIENQGNRAMEQIIDSLRLADGLSVATVAGPPFGSSEVDFQRNLGLAGQETAWSDPESIRYLPAEQSIAWVRNPNLPDEETFRRCGRVAVLMEGETLNAADDNGNGLIDEPGFCLSYQDGRLQVFLTLEQMDSNGQTVTRSWSTVLRSRN